MSDDPFERATASPPPTLGEGCVRRYDPDALHDELGAEFDEAADLWEALRKAQAEQLAGSK